MKYYGSRIYQMIDDLLFRYTLAKEDCTIALMQGDLSESMKFLYESRLAEYLNDIDEINAILEFLKNRNES